MKLLKFVGEWNELEKNFFWLRQPRTKFMEQCQEIKENWSGGRNFGIYFCVNL